MKKIKVKVKNNYDGMCFDWLVTDIVKGYKTQTTCIIKNSENYEYKDLFYVSPKYDVGDILYIKEPWQVYKHKNKTYYLKKSDFYKQENGLSYSYIKWNDAESMPIKLACTNPMIKITSVTLKQLKRVKIDNEAQVIHNLLLNNERKEAVAVFYKILADCYGKHECITPDTWAWVYNFEVL